MDRKPALRGVQYLRRVFDKLWPAQRHPVQPCSQCTAGDAVGKHEHNIFGFYLPESGRLQRRAKADKHAHEQKQTVKLETKYRTLKHKYSGRIKLDRIMAESTEQVVAINEAQQ